MEGVIHKRLVAGTKPLRDTLSSLGFKLVKTNGRRLDEINIWKKENKFVDEGYKGMVVYILTDKGEKKIEHRGLTIHDELLMFFSKRNPQNHEQKR